MSDLLLKEMDEVSLSDPKEEEEEEGGGQSEGSGRSFLLVDEHENLQVNQKQKLNYLASSSGSIRRSPS